MVTTLSPNANDTPTRPIPTCGKAAAITALPQPANVSQNVPMASAAYFFVSMWHLPYFQCPELSKTPGTALILAPNYPNQGRTRAFSPYFTALLGPKVTPPVDICAFVCYMRAPRVKRQAFAAPLLCQNSEPINSKEDAACRFSSAITMSTKLSRR